MLLGVHRPSDPEIPMSRQAQNLANHARYVPMYHFVGFALVLALVVRGVRNLMRHVDSDAIFQVVLAAALLVLFWYARAFATTVQDRVIRLEMQLRVQRLSPELAARFSQLEVEQVTALRFASDAELPDLVREVLDGKLAKGADIKRRIRDWQADWLRA